MKWDENEALHLIMMMKIIYIIYKKLFNYPTPSISGLCVYVSFRNRNNIIQIEHQLPMNTFWGLDII